MNLIVWDDMLPRVLAAAGSISLEVQMPNEDAGIGPTSNFSWLQIEIASSSDRIIEVGGHIWEERGQIFLTVMLLRGVGMRKGLEYCEALKLAFREVQGAPDGLVYRDEQETNQDKIDGQFMPITQIIHYVYQDISTP